jgi:hypothetical protein
MAGNPASLDERLASLGRAIDAARARLAERESFEHAEIGDILATINADLEAVTHDDAAAAHAAYDRIEARLAEVQPLLGSLPR